jgi:predicted Rossmann fold flavoprotein
MAAITASEAGVQGVQVWEATAEPLSKVRISGGGRCNVTHACWDPVELVGHYPRGSRSLRGAFSRFAANDAVAWFADHQVPLVAEADGRLFPQSNSSTSVVEGLRRAAAAAGVEVLMRRSLESVTPLAEGGFRLSARGLASTVVCCQLLLATGGHPSGRRIAQGLGHRLVAPVPSLFTLRLQAPWLRVLAGLSQPDVQLELNVGGQRFRQRGIVLLTHWGVSGPAVLRLTAFAARALHEHGYRGELLLNWSAELGQEELRQQLRWGRQGLGGRQLANARPPLLQGLRRRLWLALLQKAHLDPALAWAALPRQAEQRLLELLFQCRCSVSGRGPFGEEFVTAGGVDLAEVTLARMESRICKDLYFAGELLDVDGVTGGFNFQHCWTSGWIAGKAIAAAAP